MRRIALIISLGLVLSLVWALPALARSARQNRSTDHSLRTSMNKKEPAGVYGWAVVKDPHTGKLWTPSMYPNIKVHFINRKTGRRESVYFGAGAATKLESRYNTWRYAVQFEHDTKFDGKPMRDGMKGPVQYNPLEWRFSHLEVYFRKFERTGSGTRTIWEVHCDRKSQPFSDLPDMPRR